MMTDNLFLKIIERKIPADIVYEDDRSLAFRDINPQAPVHVLIIPKKVIATHADVTEADKELLGHLHLVAAKLAEQFGLAACAPGLPPAAWQVPITPAASAWRGRRAGAGAGAAPSARPAPCS